MEWLVDSFANNAGGACTSRGWTEYFPGEPYSNSDSRVMLLEEITACLRRPEGQDVLSRVVPHGSTYSLPISVDLLCNSLLLPEGFTQTLYNKSADAISCLGAAIYDIYFGAGGGSMRPGRIHIRIFGFSHSILALKHLRAVNIGRLISVRGTVIRTGVIKPMVLSMQFSCKKCGDITEHRFEHGKYGTPTICLGVDCGSRTFKPNLKTSKLIDSQTIRIQEILNYKEHEEGRMPRTVDCELQEDLVDACGTGDVVTVCGFVCMDIDSQGTSKKNTNGLCCLYLEALSVLHSKDNSGEGLAKNGGQITAGFTSLDLEFVVKFAEDSGPHLFRNIVHSICPSIYGHELVKAGISLALLGGVRQNPSDQDKVPVRGDIHVLIVGDPGLGKSQLLKAASAIASRGVYVCGNTTTNAGLTVAVVKDALSGDFAFEAGAMVLADGGMCCIDEFDKLSAEYQALLEPMEQQCVSVAKAGLVATLPARTSVLAAANPMGGRYNRSKTVNENVKLSGPLLSRFDLVFILLDKPNKAMDQRLSEHVLALHSGSEERQRAAKEAFLLLPGGSSGQPRRRVCSMEARLQLSRHDRQTFEPLPPILLRKFIAYARQYVFPTLSPEASAVLKQFYLQLRRHANGDGSPITARQLESLVRLAEARARLELREVVSEQHALDAVDIMRESQFDKFIDERGCLDFGRSGGLSNQRESKRFLKALQQQCNIRHNAMFSTAELYIIADDIGLKVRDLDAFIASLNIHCKFKYSWLLVIEGSPTISGPALVLPRDTGETA